MGDLFGSSPSTSVINPGTYSTLDQSQQGVQSILSAFFGNQGNFTNNYSGQLAAPLTAGQSSTINDFTNASSGVASNLGTTNAGLGTAEASLTGLANSTPASFANYFQNSVVAPNEQVFNQQTLPSVERAFAGSAGGTTGSEYGSALNQATQNLDQTLSGAASSAALTEFNDAQQTKLSADSQLASNSNLPAQQLSTILGAQGQAQSTNQLADTLAQQFSQQGVTNNQSFASLLNSFLNTTTLAPNDVVTQQGTQGGLGSLLSGLGSIFGAGGNSSLAASLFG